MDPTGIIGLALAIVTAIGTHLKNRSQDAVVASLRKEVRTLSRKVAACEKERHFLKGRSATVAARKRTKRKPL